MPNVDITKVVPSLQAPFRQLAPITPADGSDLPNGACFGINCQVAGNAAVIDYYGNSVTIALSVGFNPYVVTRVKATGTTATGLTALYN